MRYSWRHLLVALLIGAAGLLAGVPGPARAVGEGGDEAEPARHLPPRWRDDPEQYRRFQDEWQAFRKLPADQQARLRRLDEQLNDEPPAARARLWAVLDRYNAWLDRLDEKERQQIETEPDTTKKLEIVRKLREREWVAHLSQAERTRLDQAAPDERARLIEKLRRAERQQREAWQTALSQETEVPPPKVVPDQLWPRIRFYEQKSLIPTLPHVERQDLRKAMQASWPEHAQLLIALAEKHPIQVPPSERTGVTRFADLPEGYLPSILGRMRPKEAGAARGRLRELQDRWPQFALAVDHLARSRKAALPDKPLGPCKPEEFMPAVRIFIETLRKDPAAAKKLDTAQGKWPDYPFAVIELAKGKNLRVPGTVLPGSKEFWDKVKAVPAD